MTDMDELQELIYSLEDFRDQHCNKGLENYRVHLDTTIHLVQTRLSALQRNARNARLEQIESVKRSLLKSKSTETDRRTSLRSVDPTTELYLGFIPPGSQSPTNQELFITQ
jgi:hypothetical protein